MKMYIAILDDVPPGIAITAACHATLACYRRWWSSADMQEWVNGVFHKVVVSVPLETFEKMKEVDAHIVITESSLDGREVAMAFVPRADTEWPKGFKFFPLYGRA
jgi:peptidyl-tRNA hydrolase